MRRKKSISAMTFHFTKSLSFAGNVQLKLNLPFLLLTVKAIRLETRLCCCLLRCFLRYFTLLEVTRILSSILSGKLWNLRINVHTWKPIRIYSVQKKSNTGRFHRRVLNRWCVKNVGKFLDNQAEFDLLNPAILILVPHIL